MIVVGGGSSTRFEGDKLLTEVAGIPVVTRTISSVRGSVDRVVLVCRMDQVDEIGRLRLGIDIVSGGSTRTGSEIAGLSALEDRYELIGIHDAARPLVAPSLIDQLFEDAARLGGAVPYLDPGLIVERSSLDAMAGLGAAQTPQVFQSGPLRAAYRAAELEGFSGHDTAEVVTRYTRTRIAAVPGDNSNVKITFPEDLVIVERLLEERSGNGPR